MYNFFENYFRKQKKLEGSLTVFNQIHYKKTGNIVGVFATSRLVTNFSCKHIVRRFTRGDCSKNTNEYFIIRYSKQI